MPKRTDLNKILVIGSGPIIIGQAAEFDYSGSQACLALKEEGYEVILVNSNPATIMTDKEIADRVYVEPETTGYIEQIIRKEKPDAILPTLGGQTGLNLAKELADSGLLEELDIELLGTKLKAIEQAEDRESFKELMADLNEPVPASAIATNMAEAKEIAERIGYPLVVRPAYTLGGSGGGFVHNDEELEHIAAHGLDLSPVTQVLIEESIAGFKEIEFEVMRDRENNALIVASMENIDPVGVHTGDSVVVSPTQTLADREFQMMRDSALKIIRALKIEGGVNIQMALDPQSFNYRIIEVNPRVSRSSALASKATGYPIAKMAAKIAVGLNLDEIKNPITMTTWAAFEPALDYVVVKIPRFPFDKFKDVEPTLGTQMKATGEVMAIGRNFEEAMQKAVSSLKSTQNDFSGDAYAEISVADMKAKLMPATNDRLFMIAELLRRGVSVEEIHDITQMDFFFLDKVENVVAFERKLKQVFDKDELRRAKELGFPDEYIAKLSGQPESAIRKLRKDEGVLPVYKMVDTAAGEFESKTPYYYSTYEEENESVKSDKPSILVVGSGPIRIGQGVEFDYATVHAVKAIQKAGYEAIIINSNPETVSTDFAISDKLYFEPLTREHVLNVIDLEQPEGVLLQFGGQTAINLAAAINENGTIILGTDLKAIDLAEDRDSFNHIIQKLGLHQPKAAFAISQEEAKEKAKEVGYPVLIRPSYVIGGQGMAVIQNEAELQGYLNVAAWVSNDHPVLIDSYLAGQEAELDLLSDGKEVSIPGIMAHIERSGVHSGDSMAVYPAITLSDDVVDQMVDASTKLANELGVIGLMNMQFIIHEGKAYVIEVNPRASRTVPFLSKVTKMAMTQIATWLSMGKSLSDLGIKPGLKPAGNMIHVKAPVFSFEKLNDANTKLAPEMKSTGEVMGSAPDFATALQKAFVAAGVKAPVAKRLVLNNVGDDAVEMAETLKKMTGAGWTLEASEESVKSLEKVGFAVSALITKDEVEAEMVAGTIDLLVDFGTNEEAVWRGMAVEQGTAFVSAIDTFLAYAKAFENLDAEKKVYELGEG
ncbi:carbamoyl-phosphate synthase large subunit [Fructobacillus sp. M2-14]|uniref:Carbamoyl phosphate synthase large chain n=1 Tax=Fructobacillus broussonetiae TaxID=2713173 RepID=A0ABS5R0T8_9LACO|nr:carbamoyl-phosphate synthase large subunit [Fructobacillus broussonetiae]MBS9338129.1 carbamoyl-phosphate synthase large subunit [Fructobacillus broussonetiae]